MLTLLKWLFTFSEVSGNALLTNNPCYTPINDCLAFNCKPFVFILSVDVFQVYSYFESARYYFSLYQDIPYIMSVALSVKAIV